MWVSPLFPGTVHYQGSVVQSHYTVMLGIFTAPHLTIQKIGSGLYSASQLFLFPPPPRQQLLTSVQLYFAELLIIMIKGQCPEINCCFCTLAVIFWKMKHLNILWQEISTVRPFLSITPGPALNILWIRKSLVFIFYYDIFLAKKILILEYLIMN